MAESGVELAMFYLQYPAYAPAIVPATATIPAYWSGASNITFSGCSGSVTVTVAPSGTTGMQWAITSVGSSSVTGGGTITKTITATAQVNGTYQIAEAIGANSGFTLNALSNITGNILATGTVVVNGLGRLLGTILGTSGSGQPPPVSPPIPPTYNNLRTYLTYTYSGHSYSAAAYNAAHNTITGTNPGGSPAHSSSPTATWTSPEPSLSGRPPRECRPSSSTAD
jgi:hypothetical protein